MEEMEDVVVVVVIMVVVVVRLTDYLFRMCTLGVALQTTCFGPALLGEPCKLLVSEPGTALPTLLRTLIVRAALVSSVPVSFFLPVSSGPYQ